MTKSESRKGSAPAKQEAISRSNSEPQGCDNMRIWDSVSKTKPSHTKRVNQRGGFTAISAQYQIKEATRQFGPIGIGWGYETAPAYRMDAFIVVPVTIWHGDRNNKFGPILGCAEMFGNRPDHDAPKKATTDAITKGLSQLGFNADVFLGMFDDNKYVAEAKAAEHAEKNPVAEGLSDAWLDGIMDSLPPDPRPTTVAEAIAETMLGEIEKYKQLKALVSYFHRHEKDLTFIENHLPEAHGGVMSAFRRKKTELTPEERAA